MFIIEESNKYPTKICGIYSIFCKINQKRYIGRSKNIRDRLYKHYLKLKKHTHENPYLQHSFDKYTTHEFICSVIEETVLNIELMKTLEGKYIKQFNCINPFGFNCHDYTGSPPPQPIKSITLKNYKTGEIVTRPSYITFAQEFNILPCCISAVARGYSKIAGNWCLPDYTPTTYRLIKNNVIETFTSVRDFCKKNNLPVTSIWPLIGGRKIEYDGWRVLEHIDYIPLYIGNTLPTQIYKYKFLTPSNSYICGNNLNKICQVSNLTRDFLNYIIKQRNNSIKGWKYLVFGKNKKELMEHVNFTLISPSGKEVLFKDLSECIKTVKCSKGVIRQLLIGNSLLAKGWCIKGIDPTKAKFFSKIKERYSITWI
jgi:hypothetical protein